MMIGVSPADTLGERRGKNVPGEDAGGVSSMLRPGDGTG